MVEKPIYAAGLDAGSRKTRLVVCALEKGRLRLLGCAAVGSEGWLKGRIADQRALADTIRTVLHEAEADAGVSVDSVVVGMGGQTAESANGRGLVELGHQREIEQRDVNRVVDRASRVQLKPDRMVLQLFPKDFVVDGQPGHGDPRKVLASQLEINVHLVTASVQEHNSLVGAVNQAHLVVEETVFEALAASYAAVLPEDRREGIALVDIGAESTELVVYYGDAMHLASTVRVCGDHFTRDLAKGLRLSFEEAERVKMEYGCCALSGRLPGERAGGASGARRPGASRRAVEVGQPDSGGARGGAVPIRARGVGPRGDGESLGWRRVSGGRGGQTAGPLRRGGARAGLPDAVRPGDRDSGLAQGNGRSGVDHGGGAGHVFGQVEGPSGTSAGSGRMAGEDSEMKV